MVIIRVVVADDHAGLRAGIKRILERAPGIKVVGEACNGLEAIEQVNRLAPDVLLLDIEMPILDGVKVAERLHKAKSPVNILALSAYDDYNFIEGVLENGASGYLTKEEAPGKVVEAIRGVAQGEKGWLSARAAQKLNGH